MIGVDTTAIIDLFKQDEKLINWIENNKQPLITNDVTYLELCAGLNPDRKAHQQEEQFYDEIYGACTNYPLTKQAAKKARELIWKLKGQGITLSLLDATIASIYLTNGVNKILTKNHKHFTDIPGLEVITY